MALTYALWLGIIALQSLLVLRLLRLQLVVRYPYFFVALTLIWTINIARWVTYHQWISFYPWIFWISELLWILSGFLVVWEIFRQTLSSFPAVRQRASWYMLAVVLVVLASHVLLLGSDGVGWDKVTLLVAWWTLQVEEWLRLLQAVLLAGMVGVVRHYQLPLGRNIAGLAVGFGLFVSLTVVNFAFQALANIDLTRFSHLYGGTSLLALAIWCHAFWVYAPNPAPARVAHLEEDYARLNAAVGTAVMQLRSNLRKALGV